MQKEDGVPKQLTWIEGNDLVAELGREDHVATRITAEREKRGWSQSELARQLEAIGMGMHQTSISKIEKPHGRRGITVDEAIAFARVFEIPLGELLLPADTVADAAALRLLAGGPSTLRQRIAAEQTYRHLVAQIADVAAVKNSILPTYIANELEHALTQTRERGLDPDDSVNVTFLRDVLEAITSRPRRGRR